MIINTFEKKQHMTPLIIDKTENTLGITLDKSSGIFLFEGKSIPENAKDFFQPVVEWLSSYISNPNTKTRVDFKLEYFNTSSSKIILDLITEFKKIAKETDLIINWYFPEYDQDMLEAGEGLAEMVSLPFNYLKR